MEEVKLVEVDRVKEWEVEKILNKRKVQEVIKYLVYWKRFIVENKKKKKNLENTKKAVAKFKRRLSEEVRKQEKLNMIEE